MQHKFKTAKQVREWIKEKWIPKFEETVFRNKYGPEKLASSLVTIRPDELGISQDYLACYRRMAKSRRLAMCRKVLKEMRYIK